MLGITRADQDWRWVAYGKHPSVKDFFSIGLDFQLAAIFSDWIKMGYPALAERRKSIQGLCSWRFWARGAQKNDLICGLLRDSYDSLGRPYPLLIIGTGPLPSWEDHWDILPSVCEKTWQQIEYFSTHKFNDLKKIENDMLKIRPPFPAWSDFQNTGSSLCELSAVPEESVPMLKQLNTQAVNEACNDTGSIVISTEGPYDSFTITLYINHVLRNQLQAAPNAIFIGGTFNESQLVFFRRPMKPIDFMSLWSSHSTGNNAE
jgi:type VI secretion system protein VasJ